MCFATFQRGLLSKREVQSPFFPAGTTRRVHLAIMWGITIHADSAKTFIFGFDVTVPKCPTFGQGSLPCHGTVCTAGDHILTALIIRDLASNAWRPLEYERQTSKIINKVTHDHALACAHARYYAFTRQLKMSGVRSMFCVLLGLWLQTSVDKTSSFVFRKQNTRKRAPMFALYQLCIKGATLCLEPGFERFPLRKSDLGLLAFGCVNWSVLGKVEPKYFWD